MKKKIVSLLLVATMAASMFAGCGAKDAGNSANASNENTGTQTQGEQQEAPKEVEKISIYVPTAGKTEDLAAVMEAVNKISVPEIGVEVEFNAFEFGQWFKQYPMLLSGDEADIVANYGGYLSGVSQEAFYDVKDLLQEYGKDIVAMEGDYLKSGEINGAQYAVPIYAGYSWTMGIIYRKDVVEELGLTDKVAAVKTLADWGAILEEVKNKKPEMTPYVTINGSQAPNFKYGLWDDLGNYYGVLMNAGTSSEVTNLFETKEYAELCSVMHDWYTKGYTDKDIQTQTDAFQVLTKNDAAFSTIGQGDFNTSFYQTTTCGKDIGVVLLGDSIARTYNNVTYSVMSTTEHPEACVKFMNLWFSNKEVGTLISYGIEGVHYELDENGMGTYINNDPSSCTYHLGSNLSNINRILWSSENPDYPELLVEGNNNAVKSVGLGFAFDTANVANEITALDNVCSKYQIGLESGALDPATELPVFIEELKKAGIEKVIAEKQSQLDAFLGK